jgi:hypothetical protein
VPTRAVVACCLAALTAACGATLDTPGLESKIGEQLEGRFSGSGWTVDCPDRVEPEAGDMFACTATTDDGEEAFDISVTQDDREGSVTWRIVE